MARFCTGCGAPVDDDKKFCTECGAPVTAAEGGTAQQPAASVTPGTPQAAAAVADPPRVYAQPTPLQPAYPTAPPIASPTPGGEAAPGKGSKYEPITAGGYIGIMLLMCIPILGQILTIVWACGGCRKVNKRSLARASLIMMAVALVLSLVIGFFARGLISNIVNQVEDRAGISVSGQNTGNTDDTGGLLGIIGGLTGSDSGSDVTNRDIEALEELDGLLGALGGEESGLSDFIDGAQQANRDAEAANDGWPKTLRAYPGGTSTAVASYRTEITDTTLEEMLAWIEDLKKDGFSYQDFYEFGMTEEDMLGMNGWWAYDGNTYLSVSFSEGKVTVDHTKELPDLSSYFGG